MTVKEAVDFVEGVKPHAFTKKEVLQWLNEVEGYVQSEVMLLDTAHNLTRYTWDENQNTEMLVRPPHDKVYLSYLKAMVDFNNGEYDRYQNSMALYNAHMNEYECWYTETYHPADITCGGD